MRLVKLVAPILCHTAEETWGKIPGVPEESVHMQVFDVPDKTRLEDIEGSMFQARFAAVLETRGEIFAAFEQWKTAAGIKDSQDVVVSGTVPVPKLEILRTFTNDELALFFKVSWVELSEGPTAFAFQESPYQKCERSRLRRPDVEQVEVDGETIWLTQRDRRALGL